METSHKIKPLIYFLVFALIAVWPMINGLPIRIWAIPFSIIFLILGMMNSKLLTPLKIIWIKLGEILGIIISPIVMLIIYFFIITPIGLLMRVIGKHILGLKFNNSKTYWNKRLSKNTMKNNINDRFLRNF